MSLQVVLVVMCTLAFLKTQFKHNISLLKGQSPVSQLYAHIKPEIMNFHQLHWSFRYSRSLGYLTLHMWMKSRYFVKAWTHIWLCYWNFLLMYMIKKTRIVGPWMLFSTCKQSKCGYRCTVLLMGSHYFSSQKVVIGQDKQQCLNIFLKCVNVHNFGIVYIVYKNGFFS